MKIWRFFRIPDEVELYENLRAKDKFPLYAITNDKKLAKIFKRSRKKSRYICKCTEKSKSECIEYMNRNRSRVIGYHNLMTSINDRLCSVKVLMTDGEEDIIRELADSLAIYNDVEWINPTIFNSEYQKILEGLGYTKNYQYLTGEYVGCDISMDDGDMYNFLGIFLKMYSDDLNLVNFPDSIKY